MSSLAVLLPLATATAQTEFAYAMTPDGRTAGVHATALAALLPQPTGAGAEVIAIAPAAAISWHKVDLPRGTHAGSPRLSTSSSTPPARTPITLVSRPIRARSTLPPGGVSTSRTSGHGR